MSCQSLVVLHWSLTQGLKLNELGAKKCNFNHPKHTHTHSWVPKIKERRDCYCAEGMQFKTEGCPQIFNLDETGMPLVVNPVQEFV